MCADCRTFEVEMEAQRERQNRDRHDAVAVHPDTDVTRLTV